MLLKTLLGLHVGVSDNDLARLQEVVESHCAILLVLWLAKLLAFLLDLLNDLGRGLSALKFGFLFRLFLGNHNFTETLELLIIFEIVVFAALGQVSKIEAEFNLEGI